MCPSFSQFAGSLLAGTYTGDQMKNVDSKITGSSESTLEIKNYTGVGNVFLLHFSAPWHWLIKFVENVMQSFSYFPINNFLKELADILL